MENIQVVLDTETGGIIEVNGIEQKLPIEEYWRRYKRIMLPSVKLYRIDDIACSRSQETEILDKESEYQQNSVERSIEDKTEKKLEIFGDDELKVPVINEANVLEYKDNNVGMQVVSSEIEEDDLEFICNRLNIDIEDDPVPMQSEEVAINEGADRPNEPEDVFDMHMKSPVDDRLSMEFSNHNWLLNKIRARYHADSSDSPIQSPQNIKITNEESLSEPIQNTSLIRGETQQMDVSIKSQNMCEKTDTNFQQKASLECSTQNHTKTNNSNEQIYKSNISDGPSLENSPHSFTGGIPLIVSVISLADSTTAQATKSDISHAAVSNTPSYVSNRSEKVTGLAICSPERSRSNTNAHNNFTDVSDNKQLIALGSSSDVSTSITNSTSDSNAIHSVSNHMTCGLTVSAEIPTNLYGMPENDNYSCSNVKISADVHDNLFDVSNSMTRESTGLVLTTMLSSNLTSASNTLLDVADANSTVFNNNVNKCINEIAPISKTTAMLNSMVELSKNESTSNEVTSVNMISETNDVRHTDPDNMTGFCNTTNDASKVTEYKCEGTSLISSVTDNNVMSIVHNPDVAVTHSIMSESKNIVHNIFEHMPIVSNSTRVTTTMANMLDTLCSEINLESSTTATSIATSLMNVEINSSTAIPMNVSTAAKSMNGVSNSSNSVSTNSASTNSASTIIKHASNTITSVSNSLTSMSNSGSCVSNKNSGLKCVPSSMEFKSDNLASSSDRKCDEVSIMDMKNSEDFDRMVKVVDNDELNLDTTTHNECIKEDSIDTTITQVKCVDVVGCLTVQDQDSNHSEIIDVDDTMASTLTLSSDKIMDSNHESDKELLKNNTTTTITAGTKEMIIMGSGGKIKEQNKTAEKRNIMTGKMTAKTQKQKIANEATINAYETLQNDLIGDIIKRDYIHLLTRRYDFGTGCHLLREPNVRSLNKTHRYPSKAVPMHVDSVSASRHAGNHAIDGISFGCSQQIQQRQLVNLNSISTDKLLNKIRFLSNNGHETNQHCRANIGIQGHSFVPHLQNDSAFYDQSLVRFRSPKPAGCVPTRYPLQVVNKLRVQQDNRREYPHINSLSSYNGPFDELTIQTQPIQSQVPRPDDVHLYPQLTRVDAESVAVPYTQVGRANQNIYQPNISATYMPSDSHRTVLNPTEGDIIQGMISVRTISEVAKSVCDLGISSNFGQSQCHNLKTTDLSTSVDNVNSVQHCSSLNNGRKRLLLDVDVVHCKQRRKDGITNNNEKITQDLQEPIELTSVPVTINSDSAKLSVQLQEETRCKMTPNDDTSKGAIDLRRKTVGHTFSPKLQIQTPLDLSKRPCNSIITNHTSSENEKGERVDLNNPRQPNKELDQDSRTFQKIDYPKEQTKILFKESQTEHQQCYRDGEQHHHKHQHLRKQQHKWKQQQRPQQCYQQQQTFKHRQQQETQLQQQQQTQQFNAQNLQHPPQECSEIHPTDQQQNAMKLREQDQKETQSAHQQKNCGDDTSIPHQQIYQQQRNQLQQHERQKQQQLHQQQQQQQQQQQMQQLVLQQKNTFQHQNYHEQQLRLLQQSPGQQITNEYIQQQSPVHGVHDNVNHSKLTNCVTNDHGINENDQIPPRMMLHNPDDQLDIHRYQGILGGWNTNQFRKNVVSNYAYPANQRESHLPRLPGLGMYQNRVRYPVKPTPIRTSDVKWKQMPNTGHLGKQTRISNLSRPSRGYCTLPAVLSSTFCSVCKQQSRFICSSCLRSTYCSEKCQADHWSDHKLVCKGQ